MILDGGIIEKQKIYLNHAAGAFPLAPGVLEAMTARMINPPQVSGRDTFGESDDLCRCRQSLARLMNVKPEQIVLTCNATHGLNTAILGFGLKPGDLVITSVMEHNSVLRPLARLEDMFGIRAAYLPLDTDMRLDENAYDGLLMQKPRLAILCHASNVTGRINPVASLFKKAKSAGAVTILDASQTAGRIPVRPKELYADMTVFSGYKGLGGPLGTGVLYVAPDVNLSPVFVGGTGVKSDLRLHPEEMPMRLEAGTPNTHAFAGLNAAVEYNIKKAADILNAERVMAKELYRKLKTLSHIRIFDVNCEDKLPTVSFAVEGMDTEQAGFALSESFGICCRAGLHCAPLIHKYLGSLPEGTVRISASYKNSPEDIEYATDALRRLKL